MSASGTDCHDALKPVHNGGTNNDRGASQPSYNGFTPAGLNQQSPLDNSGFKVDRLVIVCFVHKENIKTVFEVYRADAGEGHSCSCSAP